MYNEFSTKKQLVAYNLDKIDNPELAYLIGFMLGDGELKNDLFSISISLSDKEVLYRISSYFNGRCFEKYITDKSKRLFPKIRYCRKINGLKKIFGGELKKDRNFPIVSKELERYILLGLFDAEGCITFGRRKDRNRLWHKISFTSKYGILIGVQQMLLKRLNISTAIHPKSNEDCYVLEFANKKDVITFCEFIYSDNFNSLERKKNKYSALRLELGEFGGSESYTEPSL